LTGSGVCFLTTLSSSECVALLLSAADVRAYLTLMWNKPKSNTTSPTNNIKVAFEVNGDLHA
jgi:hypothetical protein